MSGVETENVRNAKHRIEEAIKTTTSRELVTAQEMQDTLLEIYSMLQHEVEAVEPLTV